MFVRRSLSHALVLLLVLSGKPASAFKLDEGGHGGITRDALAGIAVTLDGETLKFSEKAREEIRDANFAVDLNQLAASLHFDDEALDGGTARINSLKERTISLAKGGDGPGARKALGGALHTVQDFFAHSNHVESGGAIPNFGVATLAPLPASTATCTGTGEQAGSVLIPNIGTTSGYFKLSQLICGFPAGKCRHGLAACEGIAKDEAGHPLHNVAYSNAVTASTRLVRQIVDDPRMTSDPPAIKRLLDVKPLFGTVIDDTGSMDTVIASVAGTVFNLVDATRGTRNEPDKYLLERFNDPDVGAPAIFSKAAAYLSAVNSITVSGGGDCPELSMSGTYAALQVTDHDSRIYVFTDASAKDGELTAAASALARQKRVKVSTALSGACSPYDPAYFELARATGGQVMIMTRFDTPETLASLVLPMLSTEMRLTAQASFELTGSTRSTTVPVDESVTEAVFIVGMVKKGTIEVRRPDGSAVLPGTSGVQVTDTEGSRLVRIAKPESGNWTVEVMGTGTALVTAAVASPTDLNRFEFARREGRTGHQGLFAIEGLPIADKIQMVRASISGPVKVSEFSFRRPDGSLISRFNLQQSHPLGGVKEEWVGEVVPPSEPFLVYLSGASPTGKAVQRVLSGERRASTVEVRLASDITSASPGQSASIAFSITNHGPAGSFQLRTVDTWKYAGAPMPAALTLAQNESATVLVPVVVPASAGLETEFIVSLLVSGESRDATNTASATLNIEAPITRPRCETAAAKPSILRSVNHKLVPIEIVGVTDAAGMPARISVTAIAQDEPLSGYGSGGKKFDADGIGTATPYVRAERSGRGDGRVYRIAFDAFDTAGGKCSGSVKVEVPHDRRTGAPDNGSAVMSIIR